MTLRHLKIFTAVCEHGSTTKAAKALYIVQPTVSLAISELEKYYGVTLFDRINQRLVLTDVGVELLAKAKEILAGFEDFDALASFSGKSPKVRIGATLTLGQMLIPKFLQHLTKIQLPVRPRILIRQATSLERELEQGNLDFAVIGGDIHSRYLTATPISNERFIAVVNASYDIPDTLTVNELTNYPLLLREHGSSSRDFLEKVAASKGIKLSPIIDATDNQTLVSALYASLGLAFLPDGYVAGHIARKKLKEVFIHGLTETRTNYLVMHRNKKLNALQQQAYDILKTI